jgi:hypothetical protein
LGPSLSTSIRSGSDIADSAENRRSWSGGRLRGWVVEGSKGCRGTLLEPDF